MSAASPSRAFHPFAPRWLSRPAALVWLKRTHAWTGLYGALLFLMLGTSGFLLNHRTLLKIDVGEPVEVSMLDVAVTPGEIRDAEALDGWARRRLGIRQTGKAPPPAPAVAKAIGGVALPEAERWTRVFNLPDAKLTLSMLPGAGAVTVEREALGVLAILKNLHKGTGLGVAWVLLIDTLAGALIAMSLTGFLLWSRLHGPRLLAGGLAGASLAWAFAAAAPWF